MNLRAAQVAIIQEYIQNRVTEHERKVAENPGVTVGDIVARSMSEAAIMELKAVYRTVDCACEFGEPEKEAA